MKNKRTPIRQSSDKPQGASERSPREAGHRAEAPPRGRGPQREQPLLGLFQLVGAEVNRDLALLHRQIPVRNVVIDTPPRTAAISVAWAHPAMMHSAKPTPDSQMHPSRASRRMALRHW